MGTNRKSISRTMRFHFLISSVVPLLVIFTIAAQIILALAKAEDVQVVRLLALTLGGPACVVLLFAFVAEWFTKRTVAKPLAEMAVHAERVGAGSLDHFKTSESNVEIDRLTSALNLMVDSLGKSREELLRRADIDGMTGLSNHRYIQSRLDQELKRALRSGKSLSVLMGDIDNFRLFNDTHGHPVGDRVLHLLTRTILKSCRETDIVGRYGGDEFIVLLPDTDREGAVQIADRIKVEISRLDFSVNNGQLLPIGLSMGLAVFPYDGTSRQELIGQADRTMDEAKRFGGNMLYVGENDQYPKEADLGMFGVLEGLVTAVNNKDKYTKAHSEDVTKYSLLLGDVLGLPQDMKMAIKLAGLLHDVGKIGIPDHILRKPGALTELEREVIKQHVLVGDMIVKDVPYLDEVSKAVLHHHERFDGAGYPHGLKGEEIPLIARLMSVADGFSAMTTDRPYRKSLTLAEAFRELERNAGSQFDPAMVKAFLTAANSEKYGSLLRPFR